MRHGVPGMQMAEEMGDLIAELLPLTTPLMEYLHRHFLRHFVEQEVIANMEADLDEGCRSGQLRVAIAFADLVGFVRFTEEAGEVEALDLIERFVEAVEDTLPGDARVVKNIGDGVMIVGQRPGGADRLGDRLSERIREALQAQDRHPLRPDHVPRRRLLRAERQPRFACRLPRPRRRGARHPAGLRRDLGLGVTFEPIGDVN